MPDTLTYTFEEVPLIIVDGFRAGHVSGSAEINFFDSGEWSVGAIYLDGYRDRDRKQVEVDTRSEIYLNLHDALENGAERDGVEAMVWSALEDAGVRVTSDFDHHNTHSFAFSGAR